MSLKDILQGKPLGHPSHPMFVHFPTALFPASLLFDLLSWGIADPALVKAAFYNIAVALFVGLLAVLTGFVDYFGMVSGSRKHKVTTWHMLANLPVILILALSLVLRLFSWGESSTPLHIIALSLIGLPLLIVGNYFGAELVYRMGMRVNTGRLRETPAILRAAASVRRILRSRE